MITITVDEVYIPTRGEGRGWLKILSVHWKRYYIYLVFLLDLYLISALNLYSLIRSIYAKGVKFEKKKSSEVGSEQYV